jgi:hypothetical protein
VWMDIEMRALGSWASGVKWKRQSAKRIQDRSLGGCQQHRSPMLPGLPAHAGECDEGIVAN